MFLNNIKLFCKLGHVTFKLSGLLESAIHASNAPHDDPDILDRMRVKMIPHPSGGKGWDVFSLEYNSRDPLNTIFTESVMGKYLKNFNFLWKIMWNMRLALHGRL